MRKIILLAVASFVWKTLRSQMRSRRNAQPARGPDRR
jgi:hypothetical protein